jgi:hypothetical protein
LLSGAAVAFILGIVGWWSTAVAEPVMINISVKAQKGSSGEMSLLNETGKQNEVLFDNQFRLLVMATREEKYLRLSTEIYDYVDGKYQLISTPAILVADNEASGIHLDTQSSGRLELGFIADY